MLLALDTSTRKMGLALYDGVQVINETTWTSHFHHTTQLAPAVYQALERAGITIRDVGALGVALGPGSFTALRVGLAFAKGLALSRHIPIVGVPTFDFLAAALPVREGIPLVVVLEAGRKRLAAGWYRAQNGKWAFNGTMEVLPPENLAVRINSPTLICGELNAEVRKILGRKWKNAMLASPARSHRRPAYLAEIAWTRWEAGDVDKSATLNPIYLSQTVQG